MDRKLSLRRIAAVVLAAFTFLAICVAGSGSLAQNTNSSTTTEDSMQNTNASTTRRGRRGRRGRRPAAADANAAPETSMGGESGTQERPGGEPTDLSGAYTGRLTMTGGHEMSGQATLTITGNQFTLEGEGMNHAGRVYAVTTGSYTGVSFFFSDLTDSATNTPVVAAVRARKSGERLTLTPVTGARTRLTFTSGRR